MARRRILLIEDEESISQPLADALRREGFQVVATGQGAAGVAEAWAGGWDLVLLDLGLPDMDGRDVCREIRTKSSVPIIMLTARGLETERIVGLELGADDYVVKPFSAAELIARIRAVLRRSRREGEPVAGKLSAGDLVVDTMTWSATRGGRLLELSKKEFELLAALMRHAGEVVTRRQLLEEIWDPLWFGSTKLLDVHMSALRKKLGDDPASPRFIHTVRGVGFRFSSAEELSGLAGK